MRFNRVDFVKMMKRVAIGEKVIVEQNDAQRWLDDNTNTDHSKKALDS
jgi:hypothetical protein